MGDVMRSLATIILATVVSAFAAGMVQIGITHHFDAGEEFIVAFAAAAAAVLVSAVVFAIALFTIGTVSANNHVALTLGGIFVASLAGFEAYVAASSGVTSLEGDVPILIGILVPSLLSVVIQWWLVHRHMRKRDAVSATAA